MGAWLRARSQGGRILLRIEDLDTPRCPGGMTKRVLSDLKTLSFDFDGKTLFQSARTEFYESEIKRLIKNGFAFACSCTRESLKRAPCRCYERKEPLPDGSVFSIRSKSKEPINGIFDDELLGQVDTLDCYDFITLRRSDGIISYNLACVADDLETGVTEVVRGQDLINVTPRQIALANALGSKGFSYLHLPLAMCNNDQKLSKQNHARAITDIMAPQKALALALSFLGQDNSWVTPGMSCSEILSHSIGVFDLSKVPELSAPAPAGTF